MSDVTKKVTTNQARSGSSGGLLIYIPPSQPDLSLPSRARNESRILRVLLVSVPTCNRSLIYHNRRVWQIKRIRSRRIIFHGDHQI